MIILLTCEILLVCGIECITIICNLVNILNTFNSLRVRDTAQYPNISKFAPNTKLDNHHLIWVARHFMGYEPEVSGIIFPFAHLPADLRKVEDPYWMRLVVGSWCCGSKGLKYTGKIFHCEGCFWGRLVFCASDPREEEPVSEWPLSSGHIRESSLTLNQPGVLFACAWNHKLSLFRTNYMNWEIGGFYLWPYICCVLLLIVP